MCVRATFAARDAAKNDIDTQRRTTSLVADDKYGLLYSVKIRAKQDVFSEAFDTISADESDGRGRDGKLAGTGTVGRQETIINTDVRDTRR